MSVSFWGRIWNENNEVILIKENEELALQDQLYFPIKECVREARHIINCVTATYLKIWFK